MALTHKKMQEAAQADYIRPKKPDCPERLHMTKAQAVQHSKQWAKKQADIADYAQSKMSDKQEKAPADDAEANQTPATKKKAVKKKAAKKRGRPPQAPGEESEPAMPGEVSYDE